MLIATAAMGFVALGAAGVGTAAWYVTSGSATAAGDAATGVATLTTQKSEKTLGTFTFVPNVTDPIAADQVVDLTTTGGLSYVWLDNLMSSKIQVNPTNPTAHYVITGFTVTYDGDITDATELNAAYAAAISGKTLWCNVSSEDGAVRLCAAEAGTGSFVPSSSTTNLAASHTWTSGETTAKTMTLSYASAIDIYVAVTGSETAVEDGSTHGTITVVFEAQI